MSEIKLVVDDSVQIARMKAMQADIDRLLVATVKPHLEFTIGPITKQETTDDGNSDPHR